MATPMLQKRPKCIILGNSVVFQESKITLCQNRLNSSSQNLNRVPCLFMELRASLFIKKVCLLNSEKVPTRVFSFSMTLMRLILVISNFAFRPRICLEKPLGFDIINNIRDGGSIIPKKITLLIWLICVYMAM